MQQEPSKKPGMMRKLFGDPDSGIRMALTRLRLRGAARDVGSTLAGQSKTCINPNCGKPIPAADAMCPHCQAYQ